MKIVVCIKRAALLAGPVVLRKDASDVDPVFLRHALGDADEQAVEAGLRLVADGAGEIVALTVGPPAADEVLRKCLAMGVARAVRCWNDSLAVLDPIAVAGALASAIRREAPDLVLCGVQSVDAGQQLIGPALAGHLGWPVVTVATRIEAPAGGPLRVHRERGGGHIELCDVALPAVLTLQTGSYAPRAATFKATLAAKKAAVDLHDPGPQSGSRLRLQSVAAAARRRSEMELIAGNPAAVAEHIAALLRARSR